MLENSNKPTKTKEEYSRNVKLLKLKLEKAEHLRVELERKRKSEANIVTGAKRLNNDRVIAMKISKFCRERKFTPEMLFRFADRKGTGEVDQAEFKTSLTQLGLKLSVEELSKLVLLIDEDVSGKVSIGEYYAYLSAFNMRAQPTTDEPFVVSGLKKMNKLIVEGALGIKIDEFVKDNTKETTDEEVGADNRKRRLPRYKYMDYEEFYRFCKKHQPGMKDKELLGIFNRLDPENTGLILIDELRQFLKEGQKELDKKNARIVKREDSPMKEDGGSVIKKPASVKELLQLVLRNRTHKGRFHLNEFKTVAARLGSRQEIGELFRSIDESKQGSFDYNQVVAYYLKKKDPTENYNFAYEIMQLGLENADRRIDQVLFTNKLVEGSEMNAKVFAEFMHAEFGIDEVHANSMHEQLLNEYQVKRLDASHVARKFREVAKQSKAKNPYQPDLDNIISLNYFGTKAQDFLRKGCGTIVKNPMVALRFCVQLENEIQRQNKEKWSDYEFGPSPNDAKGLQSLVGLSESPMSQSMPPENELTWIRATDLGFTQFYSPVDNGFQEGRFQDGFFLSALSYLCKTDKEFLTKELKQPPPGLKELTDNELQPIFTGLYPRVFHYFAKYGIYVFRMFIEDCWAYVLIDDLLPCTTRKEPLASSSSSKKYSWIPLVQKAYAKVKGGYCTIFGQTTLYQSFYQLSRQVPSEYILPQKYSNEIEEDDTWKTLCNFFPKEAPPKLSCFNSTHAGELKVDGTSMGLRGSEPISLVYAMELGDIRLDNYHKSHRLLFLRKPDNYSDVGWNKNWSQQLPESKFFDYNDEIRDEVKKAKNYGLLLPTCLIVDYSLFRSLYDSVFGLSDMMGWEGCRAHDFLDKQKNGKFVTKYRLRLSQPSEVLFTILSLERFRPSFFYSLDNVDADGDIDVESSQHKWPEGNRALTIHNSNKLEPGKYLLTIWSKDPFNYSLSVYFKHTSYKFARSPNNVDFGPIKGLEKPCFNQQSAGDKTMQYLETRFFRLPSRRKTACCC